MDDSYLLAIPLPANVNSSILNSTENLQTTSQSMPTLTSSTKTTDMKIGDENNSSLPAKKKKKTFPRIFTLKRTPKSEKKKDEVSNHRSK
jgi:hypothetical protein